MNTDDVFGLIVSLIFGAIIVFRAIWGIISGKDKENQKSKHLSQLNIPKKNAYNTDDDDDLRRLIQVKKKKSKKQSQKNKNRTQEEQQLEQTAAFTSPVFQKPEPSKRIFADKPTKHVAKVAYHTIATRKDSRAAVLVKQLKSPQDMIIIQEVIGRCRSKELLDFED
jgi:hypothetical protein